MQRWRGNPAYVCLVCALWLLAATTVWAAPSPAGTASQAADAKTLTFGILPFESPITLFKRFAPLRDYLAQALGRPVAMETAKDFPRFIQRLAKRKYDIVLAAPHIALRTLDQGRYTVIATHTAPLAAMLVVPEDSPIHDPAQLAGLSIATPSEKAIVTMIGKNHLRSLGLAGAQAPHYRVFRTHNAAFQSVMSGQTSAAIIANIIYYKAKRKGVKLRLLSKSKDFPGMAILVGNDLPPQLRDTIRDDFVALKDSAAGRQLLKRISHPGYQAAQARDLESLRPYLDAPQPTP
jgi:phosphonate transport system substrate-binding protein